MPITCENNPFCLCGSLPSQMSSCCMTPDTCHSGPVPERRGIWQESCCFHRWKIRDMKLGCVLLASVAASELDTGHPASAGLKLCHVTWVQKKLNRTVIPDECSGEVTEDVWAGRPKAPRELHRLPCWQLRPDQRGLDARPLYYFINPLTSPRDSTACHPHLPV